MRHRRQFHGDGIAAERFTVTDAEGSHLRRGGRHHQRLAPLQRSGDRTEAQRGLPALHAARSIEAAQHVVERHEVHGVIVGDRQTDDVGAGLPSPLDLAVRRVQTVEESILRSEEDPIVVGEDVVTDAAERALPDDVAASAGRARRPVCRRWRRTGDSRRTTDAMSPRAEDAGATTRRRRRRDAR